MIKKVLLPCLFLCVPVASAEQQCKIDSGLAIRIAMSSGNFDVNHINEKVETKATHNNASRIGGHVSLNCNATKLSYVYHRVIELPGATLKTNTIINKVTISNPSFGQLTLGKITTPYKAAGKKGDFFWDTPAGTTFAANSFGFSNMTRGFTDNSIVYQSPKIESFSVNLGFSGENSHGDYHAGIEKSGKNYTAGIQYITLGKDPFVANHQHNDHAIRLYTRYQGEHWSFSSSIERVRENTGLNEHFFNLSAQRKIDGFGRLAFSYGSVTRAKLKLFDGSHYNGNGKGPSAGVFYDWTKNSEIYLLTSRLDFENGIDQRTIAVGMNYHFTL